MLQSKAKGVFPPKRIIADSRRVLATIMDDGWELLLALAPSTSLCTQVQQGRWVTLVTYAHAYLFQPGKTMAECRFDCTFRALDPLRIPAWAAFWRGYSWSLTKPKGKSTFGIVGSIVFCLSLLQQANTSLSIIAIDQHPGKARNLYPPPLPKAILPGALASGIWSFRKKGRSQNASRNSYSSLLTA